jgi:hypothetical protein
MEPSCSLKHRWIHPWRRARTDAILSMLALSTQRGGVDMNTIRINSTTAGW